MKNLYFALSLLAMGYISSAQNVYIPDANFKNALISFFDKNKDGEISYSEAEAITHLSVSNKNISDMTGIEAFVNLEILYCPNNKLTSLDVSNNTALTGLYCSGNELTSLDISNDTALSDLYCWSNQFTSLDISDNVTLTDLRCECNQLTCLDVSKNTALKYLNCHSNQLTSLDVSNNTALSSLYCNHNQLTSLDVSNNTALLSLDCEANQLTSLDISKNTALTFLDCSANQLTSLDVSNNTALSGLFLCDIPTLYEVCVWEIPFSLGGWVWTFGSPNVYFTKACAIVNFPDTAFLYSLIDEGVDTNGDSIISYAEAEAITYLDVSHRNISDMTGINAFNNLDTLYCRWNNLTTLDISNNTFLLNLDLSHMPTLCEVCVWEMPFPLVGIEVDTTGSPNILFTTNCKVDDIVNIPDSNFKSALISAGVDADKDGEISYSEAEAISYLDVSEKNIVDMTGIEAFGDLKSLACFANQLTSLDVSNNIKLWDLRCQWNQLTSLDVSNNTELRELLCQQNQLTSLDISKNNALFSLSCGDNPLTSLDVSNNTYLTLLSCYENQLTSLDVSNNIALTVLNCNKNQLTNLDISDNTTLIKLNCSSNQLTSLEISNHTDLTELKCSGNQLTNLDIAKNIELLILWCGVNQLTSLDVSNNTALTELACWDNLLTSLDISNNTALIYLFCDENQLTSLDVSNNTALNILDCSTNQLSNLDVSNNTELEYLNLSDIPTLYKICVWEMPFPPDTVYVDTNGSPNVFFTTDCSAANLNDFTENIKINIYPNPSDDLINVEIENINNAKIEIYNVSGRLIFSKQLNSKVEKIDISGFPKGIYVVKVMQNRTVNVGKVRQDQDVKVGKIVVN